MKRLMLFVILCFSASVAFAAGTQTYTFSKSTLTLGVQNPATAHPTVIKLSSQGGNKYGLTLTNNEGIALGVASQQYPTILPTAPTDDKITIALYVNDANRASLNLVGMSQTRSLALTSTDGNTYSGTISL